MAYTEREARDLVIKAGLKLVEKELVARTWGNISARISKNEFIITPSGRAYETLTPSDLVKVKIKDLSYDGEIKPSSEKGIHASIYELRKDVNFIIHTHQKYATAISVEGLDFPFAPCAKYGLPGTKKLLKHVALSIKQNPENNAFLLERHGAVCLGENFDDAFHEADLLEVRSKTEYDKNAKEKGKKIENKPYLDDYAQMMGFSGKTSETDKSAIELIKEKNRLAARYATTKHQMSFFDVMLQNTVYKLKYSKLKK